MYHSQNKPSLKLKIHKIVSDTEIGKKFLNELSPEEIRTIRKNRDYYIKNNELRDNLNIFHYDTLLDRINKEDAHIIIKELEDVDERKSNKHKHSFSTINTTKQRRKILKEDAFTEQTKHYEKIIQKEIAKDKQRIIDNKKKLSERVKSLNKIYYKSREKQEHINKVLSRKSNKKLNYQSFLITQSKYETSKQKPFASPKIKRGKMRRQSVFNPMKRKEEKGLKETVEKIREIYTNDYYLPPI